VLEKDRGSEVLGRLVPSIVRARIERSRLALGALDGAMAKVATMRACDDAHFDVEQVSIGAFPAVH